MTTEHVSVPRELFDMAREQIERQRLAALEYGLIAVAEAHSYALHKIDAILSRATPSDVKVPEKLQFNAGDSPFIVQRKEGWNDCIEKMIGSDSQRFSLDQSFVDRVTQGDDESPDVIGAGCADSIKRVAEEMVHACKAVLQGDAEFTHDAVDDWAHRIMCFADYVPRKPSDPRVVTDDDALRFYRGIFGGDTQPNSRTLSAFKEQLESFATSMPAAIPPGCVVVPVEPTGEMCEAAMIEDDNADHSAGPRHVIYRDIYKAMLAAAPQAGEK